MKKAISSLLAAGALFLAAGAAQAGTIVTDRPSLDALLGGGGTTIDFESLAVGAGTADNLPASLTLSGVTFAASSGGNLQADGAGYYGAPSKELLANFSDTMTADFGAGVNAFGLDLRAFTGFARTASVTVYAPDDSTVLATFSGIALPGSGVPLFFGFQDAGGIGKVAFTHAANSWSPIVDNLSFGAVAAVPLPPAAFLGLGLLGGLGVIGRLRKRGST